MADFERARPGLELLGIQIVAISVDDEISARKMIEKEGIGYPVFHSADATAINERVGGYLNDDPVFFQPANFIVSPQGTVAIATYSNGPIGRLTAAKCQEFIVAVGGGRPE